LVRKLIFAAYFLLSAIPSLAQSGAELDLKSIPISDWLNAGETTEIPWTLLVRDAYLRMDQRLEVGYLTRVRAKDLNRTGSAHELFLVSRISSPDGEWLNAPSVVQHSIEKELPKNTEAQFRMRVCVQPGDYVLWLVLYDRKTGKHNLAKRRIRVPEISKDPLPDVYARLPLVEFPKSGETEGDSVGYLSSELFLPVRNKHPLEVELISTLSPPEQWAGRGRLVRSHNENTVGALTVLSQLELEMGSISIVGLDLLRHEVLFEQKDFRGVNWTALREALEKADSPRITAKALGDRKNNGAFFREFLSERLGSDGSPDSGACDHHEEPLRVFIVVTGSWLFERGSDLTPLQLEGDCRCRIYHLRFRLNNNDLFDELAKVMKPLRPKTFNLLTPRDLRKAIAEILEDLGNL
jgi:hypothetical protein